MLKVHKQMFSVLHAERGFLLELHLQWCRLKLAEEVMTDGNVPPGRHCLRRRTPPPLPTVYLLDILEMNTISSVTEKVIRSWTGGF